MTTSSPPASGASPQDGAGLTRFNALPHEAADALLTEVCAARDWAAALAGGRPYATPEALYAASDAALAELDADGLDTAMAGHPPIGRPKPGDPTSSREQRGMADAGEELKAEMLELNLAYQERFGHVFLICATGLDGKRMRDALAARLENTPERERENARTELAKINRIRLGRLLAEPAAAAPA
ncbi:MULTISPECIES: 2-oxo-4-hydroxy-4-carboxy-5-ureidoimidazoline decarboxylase [Streptomyces diastaticus group]|uniref:2-oxo-4-hydroxy-4-carboxy-5-ureidoimidazoline decarboxylase n=1 Tax=Streptomyces diastaticus group TaxID=2849069 RepID=UPI0013CC49EC|nr:2-oxo-4-hydroxy-4-carboxy-5-ureidoimidazoline decarboxylase [Streptomyces rutgersensis]GFH68438.1 2-oxo-4-hydroxy-4-carboxy-5-ureidoimidazoline decarboxylase [Streptomyces rutgersensis]